MQLAFILYKYFPFGGLQRDFLRIALECQRRGHKIRVYTLSWEGEIPEGFELVIVPVKAWFNHRRNERMTAWMKTDLVKRPVDKVIGFNKMPGLDIYYAADGCYEEKAQNLRNRIYTRSERYKHFSGYEKAVFSAESNTQILMISEMQQPLFVKYYQTQISRFHSLPPGVAFDRKAPSNADEIRLHFRSQLKLSQDEYLLLQIGSGFKTKGLDRTLNAIAALPESIKCKVKLIVLGQDDPRLFLQQIQRLNITEQVDILKGRDDVPNFLLSADLLIHPAYHENTGTVLLEALVAGLPVIVSAVCGYAKYIEQAQSGVVLDDPFSQDQLNKILSDTLLNEEQRMQWKDNALIFAEGADLYSMPQKAADVILADYL
ncbi:UNVERIFIED_CONTAM: hypothetical protein GTU68_000695 [Idotea baltica]|nr:hypothetical protein [Idotea baltica]